MGMYTEMVLKIEVPKSTDKNVLEILHFMFNQQPHEVAEGLNLPNHPLFKADRWTMIGRCSSFYHHPRALADWYDVDYSEDIHIFSRFDLKNYDDEIGLFVDWVTPYIKTYGEPKCIGWKWYEEDREPTLIFID